MNFRNFLLYVLVSFGIFIQFQNKSLAQSNLFKIYDKDKYEVSSVIYDSIQNSKANIYKADVENGFFYIQPRFFLDEGGRNNKDYIIFNLKQVDKDVYMFVKNSFNSLPKREKMIGYIRENGITPIKIKNKELISKLESNSQDIIDGKLASNEIINEIDKDIVITNDRKITYQEKVRNTKQINEAKEKRTIVHNREVYFDSENLDDEERSVSNKQTIEVKVEEKNVVKNSLIKGIIDFGFDCALLGIFF